MSYFYSYDLPANPYCIYISNFVGGGGLAGEVRVDGVLKAAWHQSDFQDNLTVCFDVEGIEPPPLDPTPCTPDEIEDCNNRCAPPNYLVWQGDGFCDDGRYYLDFNCDAFGFDGGDCQ